MSILGSRLDLGESTIVLFSVNSIVNFNSQTDHPYFLKVINLDNKINVLRIK